MIRVAPFSPNDLLEIDVQPAQRSEDYRVSLYEMGKAQSASGMAFTARDAETGRILICGGASEWHKQHASLWAVLATSKSGNMQLITRRVRAFIDQLPHRRVDAMIHSDFAAAKRWAHIIGLFHEATLADAMPDGGDALIFRRKA